MASIRRLTAADLSGYKALRDAVMAANPAAFTSGAAPERSAESYLSRLGLEAPSEGAFTLGAWRSGRLLGAVTCERDARPKVRHVGQVVGMMVAVGMQRQGIGQALVAACIHEARQAGGLSMLTLTVTSSNAAAVRLYARNGFHRYGRLERALLVDGAFHAKDLMVLEL